MGHHHEIAIRYGEVDQQRVVFNAHYLAYLDDAMDRWMRELDASFESLGWDFMVKRADLTWLGGAGIGDTLEIELAVARWGTTSFVIAVTSERSVRSRTSSCARSASGIDFFNVSWIVIKIVYYSDGYTRYYWSGYHATSCSRSNFLSCVASARCSCG